MAGPFDDREKSFEAKWARNEQWRFQVIARRNRLLGLWAAAEMAMPSEAAQAYAGEVVASDFEKPGEEDVFEKVRKDFDAKGISLSDRAIRRKMEELIAIAQAQIEAELSR